MACLGLGWFLRSNFVACQFFFGVGCWGHSSITDFGFESAALIAHFHLLLELISWNEVVMISVWLHCFLLPLFRCCGSCLVYLANPLVLLFAVSSCWARNAGGQRLCRSACRSSCAGWAHSLGGLVCMVVKACQRQCAKGNNSSLCLLDPWLLHAAAGKCFDALF